MYKRKTKDIFELYVDYGGGWEYELTEESKKEIYQRIKEYNQNCPYPVMFKKKRERIEE